MRGERLPCSSKYKLQISIYMTHKIQANASGTRSIEVSDLHLQTLRRYRLLDQLVGSDGIIDETVVDKLKMTVRSLLSGAFGSDKDLLDLCLDVIYNKHMKSIGLTNLLALYKEWEEKEEKEEEEEEV